MVMEAERRRVLVMLVVTKGAVVYLNEEKIRLEPTFEIRSYSCVVARGSTH